MEFTLDNITPQARAYFDRQLTFVREEVVQDKKPNKNGFLFLTQANDIPEWADEYTHEMWEPVGIAQLIANSADDIPMADVSFREETFKVRDFGIGYSYTIKELMQAQATNKQITTKRAEACRLGMEECLNRIQVYGDPTAKLFGWLSFPNTPRLPSASKIAGVTPSTVLGLLNTWVNSIQDTTETVAAPTRMFLAPADYNYIASTPLDLSGGAETTILQHFLKNNPYIKEVNNMIECKGAGPLGGNIVVIDSDNTFEHKMVQPFTQLPSQPVKYRFETYCLGRSGGTVSDFPLEGLIVELPV